MTELANQENLEGWRVCGKHRDCGGRKPAKDAAEAMGEVGMEQRRSSCERLLGARRAMPDS